MSPRYNFRNRNKVHETCKSTTNHEEQCDCESVELNVRRSKTKKSKKPNTVTANKNRNRNSTLGFILKRLGLSPGTPKHLPSRRTIFKDHSEIKSSDSDKSIQFGSGRSPFRHKSALQEETVEELCSNTNVAHASCEVPQAPIRPESPLVHYEIHTKTPESAPRNQQESNVDCVFRRPLPMQSPLVRDCLVSHICNSSVRHNLNSEAPGSQSFRTPQQSPVSKLPYYSSEFTFPSPVVSKPFSSPCLRDLHLFKVPSSPAFNQVHVTPALPCLMLTPNLGLGSASQLTNASPSVLPTPSPSNQWDSPCIPSEVMSTPFLMKTTIEADCPDLINMIDDELGSVQAFDHSLRLYDHIDLTDIDVADYVSSLSESFAVTGTESVSRSPVIRQKVVQTHAQGRYRKQMTEELLEAVKTEQKRKDRIRKDLKKEESKDALYDDRRFQQTISKDGRRTRAILRKCDELGISLAEVCVQKDEE